MAEPNNQLPDLDPGKLNIGEHDKTARKFMMLVEGTFGIGVKASIKKYGYTEQAYYKIKKSFLENGSEGLVNQKTGPKENHVCTNHVEMQIIRLRFIDPDDTVGVIAQKLQQMGTTVSKRSVERTITKYGLQKKTFISSTQTK